MSKPHPHAWDMHRAIARLICRYCGLVWLRNHRSDVAARGRCRWWDEE